MGLETLFQKIAVPKVGNIYQSQVTLKLDFVGCVSSEQAGEPADLFLSGSKLF